MKQIFEEAGKFASNILAPLNSIGDKKGITLENGLVRMPAGFKDAYNQYIEGGWSSVAEWAHWLYTLVRITTNLYFFDWNICSYFLQVVAELVGWLFA